MLKAETSLPKVRIEKRTIFASLYNSSQTAAIITTESQADEDLHLRLADDKFAPYFRLIKGQETDIWQLQSVPGLRCFLLSHVD